MATKELIDSIKLGEGLRLKAYEDVVGVWTVGYGHAHVAPGTVWTREQAEAALLADIEKAEALLDKNLPWWRKLSEPRAAVLCEMCFNMGWGSLSGFHHTLEAIRLELYAAAAEGMLASKWAKQVGARATRLAEQMRTGVRAPSPADQDTEADDVTGGPDPA